jgi:hypothetical protein
MQSGEEVWPGDSGGRKRRNTLSARLPWLVFYWRYAVHQREVGKSPCKLTTRNLNIRKFSQIWGIETRAGRHEARRIKNVEENMHMTEQLRC